MAIKLRKFSKKQPAEEMEKWAYKVAHDYNSEIKGILESGGSKSQILAAMDEEIEKICKQLDKKEDREFSDHGNHTPDECVSKKGWWHLNMSGLSDSMMEIAEQYKSSDDEPPMGDMIDITRKSLHGIQNVAENLKDEIGDSCFNYISFEPEDYDDAEYDSQWSWDKIKSDILD